MCEECKEVEHHLWSNDSHPAYRGIRALRSSKPIPWCTAVKPLSHLDVLASLCRRMKNLANMLAHIEYVMGKFCIF